MSSRRSGSIGRYLIDRRIGSGGMAHTYRCILKGPGGFEKLVLVKVLQPDHADSKSRRQMFLDEAKLCSLLRHPHIPQVFELGEHNSNPFLVMEYVAGPNLVMVARKLRHKDEVPYHLVAHLFSGVARALHYAHTLRGRENTPLDVVHRDVTLANILVSQEGSAKLIDFGIAKWSLGEAKTEVGSIKGKLRYMAPEQFEADDVGHLVDIYQLGVSMYWLAAGKPPFPSGGVIQQIAARLEKKPPSPTEHRPDFPEPLAAIILKCLHKDPAARFATAEEVAKALEDFSASAQGRRIDESSVAAWVRDLFPEEEYAVFTSTSRSMSYSDTFDLHDRTLGTSHTHFEPMPAIPPMPRDCPAHLTGTHTGSQSLTQDIARGVGVVGVLGLFLVAGVAVSGTLMTTPSLRALFAASPERAQRAQGADDLLTEAEQAIDAGRIGYARSIVRAVLDTEDLEATLVSRATALQVRIDLKSRLVTAERSLARGRLAEALNEVTAALDLEPQNAEALALERRLIELTRPTVEGQEGDAPDTVAGKEPARVRRPRPKATSAAPTTAAPNPAAATATPAGPVDAGSEEQAQVRPDPTRSREPPRYIQLEGPKPDNE